MAIKLDDYISAGVDKLEKKFLGGVTLRSAQNAIRETAQSVEAEMNRISRATVEEINAENIRNAQQMERKYLADLESKDRKMLSLSQSKAEAEIEKNSLQTKLDKLAKRIENAFRYDEIDTLADGSKVYAKVSLGGTRAVKTVNTEGKLTQLDINAKNGLFRRTTYNPETQKPTRRVTNATKDGKTVEILFDNYGNIKEIQTLNIKKVKPEAPKVVGIPKIVENTDYHTITETYYSDGSKVKAATENASGEIYQWTKWDNPNGFWNEYYSKDMKTGIIRKGKIIKGENGARDYELTKIEYPNGIKSVSPYSLKTDEITGLTTETTRITFPKESPIKRIDKLKMGNTSSETKHIIVLRNGDKYELTQFKSEPINSKSTSRYGKVEILFHKRL